MNAQKLGTKIHTATDHAVSTAIAWMKPLAKLEMACAILGLDVANYAHLDNGRKAMAAGNLLRGAARKNPEVAETVTTMAARIAKLDNYAEQVKEDDKIVEQILAEEDEVAAFTVKGEGSIEISWPKSARFKFAQRQEDGEWKFFYNAPKTGSYFTR